MKKIITMFIAVVSLIVISVAYCNPTQADTTQANLQPSSSTLTSVSSKVNLNTADVATIVNVGVKGIGMKRAQSIVNYRNQHGAFKTFDDLANVKGLGKNFIKSHLSKLTEVFVLR